MPRGRGEARIGVLLADGRAAGRPLELAQQRDAVVDLGSHGVLVVGVRQPDVFTDEHRQRHQDAGPDEQEGHDASEAWEHELRQLDHYVIH